MVTKMFDNRSFEKYVKEINIQMLEWSPVHTEKFWKENVKRFDDNDYCKLLIIGDCFMIKLSR